MKKKLFFIGLLCVSTMGKCLYGASTPADTMLSTDFLQTPKNLLFSGSALSRTVKLPLTVTAFIIESICGQLICDTKKIKNPAMIAALWGMLLIAAGAVAAKYSLNLYNDDKEKPSFLQPIPSYIDSPPSDEKEESTDKKRKLTRFLWRVSKRIVALQLGYGAYRLLEYGYKAGIFKLLQPFLKDGLKGLKGKF